MCVKCLLHRVPFQQSLLKVISTHLIHDLHSKIRHSKKFTTLNIYIFLNKFLFIQDYFIKIKLVEHGLNII